MRFLADRHVCVLPMATSLGQRASCGKCARQWVAVRGNASYYRWSPEGDLQPRRL